MDLVSVRVDTKPLEILADTFGGGQARYAAARLLTHLAKDSQAALVSTESRYVHIRTPWTMRGIRIDAARKDGPLVSRVGTIDAVMGDLVTGEARVPGGGRSGKKAKATMAIPLIGEGRGRESIGTVTTPKMFPGRLIKSDPKSYFSGTVKTARGELLGVWHRYSEPNATGDGKRNRLRLMYVIRDKADMDRKWPMDTLVNETIAARYAPRAMQVLDEVARTAHRRIGR